MSNFVPFPRIFGWVSESISPSLPFRLSIYYSLHFFPILYPFIFGRIRQVGLDRFRSRIRGPARPGESSREEGKLIVKGGRWKKEAAKQTAALSSDLSFEGTRRFVLPSIRRISDLENSLRSTDKSGVGSSGGGLATRDTSERESSSGGPIDCLFTRQTERGKRVPLSNSPF